MEFRHLRSFIALAEVLSFTEAARRLHLTQPQVSRHINELEGETGVRLFVRDRRNVKLSEEGRRLLGRARVLVADTARFWGAVRRIKDGDSGVVRVRVGFGLRMGVEVADVVTAYAKRYASLDFQYDEIPSGFLPQALLEQRIDVGLMRMRPNSALLASEPIFEEGLVVLLPTSNPLAKCRSLNIRQLARQRLLLHDRSLSADVYDKILSLYRSAGLVPKIESMRLWHGEAVSLFVASGKGIFIGPGLGGSHLELGGKLTTVPLEEPSARIEVYMSWRAEEKSPAIMAFIESVRNAFTGQRREAIVLRKIKKQRQTKAAQGL